MTNRKAELLGGLLRGANGDRQWAYVEQGLIWPWFYLQIVRDYDDEAMRSMLLLPSVPELQIFLSEIDDHLWIEQAQVVTPGNMNSEGRWLMEPLLEVSVVLDDQGRDAGYRFQVEGGRYYFLMPSASSSKECLNTKVVFSAPIHLHS